MDACTDEGRLLALSFSQVVLSTAMSGVCCDLLGMRQMMEAFSACSKHSLQALLLGCADLLKPESNLPVATRMEALLSEYQSCLQQLLVLTDGCDSKFAWLRVSCIAMHDIASSPSQWQVAQTLQSLCLCSLMFRHPHQHRVSELDI